MIVTGFFFLRFICPALLSPLDLGLLTPDQLESKSLRQPILLLTKLLQVGLLLVESWIAIV